MTYVLLHLQNAADFNGGLLTKEQFETEADSLRKILAESGILARNVILIDKRGKALQVEPEDSMIIGTDMSSYPTVKKTLNEGLPTISNLVSSPSLGVPVVLFNTPILNEEDEKS